MKFHGRYVLVDPGHAYASKLSNVVSTQQHIFGNMPFDCLNSLGSWIFGCLWRGFAGVFQPNRTTNGGSVLVLKANPPPFARSCFNLRLQLSSWTKSNASWEFCIFRVLGLFLCVQYATPQQKKHRPADSKVSIRRSGKWVAGRKTSQC